MSYIQHDNAHCPCTCCKAQRQKIEQLKASGYTFNKRLTISMAAVVLSRGDDVWAFGLDGSISNSSLKALMGQAILIK